MNNPLTNGQITKHMLLLILMIALLSTSAGASAFAGGDGSAGNPYQISTVEQLQLMNSDLNAHYIQVNDIDASGTRSWNDGAGFEPIGNDSYAFFGSFNGQGYNITGLYIYRPSQDYVGLFGYTTQMTNFENISLIDNNVTGGQYNVGSLGGCISGSVTQCYATGNVTGGSSVGGLIGKYFASTLSHCYATGYVKGINYSVGGLVGYNEAGCLNYSHATGNVVGFHNVAGLVGVHQTGKLNYCYATGDVTGVDTSIETGNDSIGGLVGYSGGSSSLNCCYATGNVTGDHSIGGLVGSSSKANFTHCYSIGDVTGDHSIGGLVGMDSGSSAHQCYWDINTSGMTTSFFGEGKTSEEMKIESTFVGWDFNNVWNFCDETTCS